MKCVASEMTSRGEESWQRRIGNETELWDYLAQQRLWVTIKNRTTVSENNYIFESITPLQKYKLISPLVKKIQQAQYNKDGTMSIQVLREEAENLLTVDIVGQYPVCIEKHQFYNRIRGTIESPTLCLMPENEIIEGLAAYNCTAAKKLDKPARDNKNQFIRDEDNKLKWIPSGEVEISLESETLPARVDIIGLSLVVEKYKPEPRFCKCCLQYGHYFKYCPNKAIRLCPWCSDIHHTTVGEKCDKPPKCRSCTVEGKEDTRHATTNKNCPKFKMEAKIAEVKENLKVPHWRAVEIINGPTNSYSAATNVFASSNIPVNANQTDNITEQINTAIGSAMAKFTKALNQQIELMNTKLNHHKYKVSQMMKGKPVEAEPEEASPLPPWSAPVPINSYIPQSETNFLSVPANKQMLVDETTDESTDEAEPAEEEEDDEMDAAEDEAEKKSAATPLKRRMKPPVQGRGSGSSRPKKKLQVSNQSNSNGQTKT